MDYGLDFLQNTVMRPDQYAKIYKSCLGIDEIVNTLSVRIYEHCTDTTSKWQNERSVDSYCRIFLTFEPGCAVLCNDERVELTPGSFHFFPSQLPIELPANPGVRLYFQHFHITTWAGVDLWYVLLPHPVEVTGCPKEWVEKFVGFTADPPESIERQMELLALTYGLLFRIFERGDFQIRSQSRRAVERISRALQVIEHNPQRVIPVPELARLCAMSRESFTREFNQLTGISPARYQMEHRLRLIRQLLLKSDEKLETIAKAFGFSSAYHLSGAFKRYVGISPRDFRLKNRRS